jgi:hypothetical protein
VTSVTYSRKRYIFKCAGCDCLEESARKDTLTCSPACRVRAHRSGELKRLRELAARMDVDPSAILHAGAAKRLAPDIVLRIRANERKPNGKSLSLYDFQDEIARALDKLVIEYVDRNAFVEMLQ